MQKSDKSCGKVLRIPCRQGRIIHETGEDEASGPGTQQGPEPPGTTKNFPPLWAPKLRFLLTTYLRKEDNRTKITSINMELKEILHTSPSERLFLNESIHSSISRADARGSSDIISRI